MSQRETITQPSLQLWKGVNQRLQPTLVPDGFFADAKGVFFGFGENAERLPGKRMAGRFTEPILVAYQIGRKVIVQTLNTVLLCDVEELMNFNLTFPPGVPAAPTFSNVSYSTLDVTMPVMPAYTVSMSLQRSLDGISWTTVATGLATLQIVPQSGLTDNTLYYYRAVAVNAATSTNGVVGTVTTPDFILTTPTFDLDGALGRYNATSGGSLISANNAPVLRWEDQSGNGNHFTQPTSGACPIIQTAGGPNALPWLKWDGVDDYLSRAAMTIPAFTAMFVIRLNSAAGFHALLTRNNSASALNQPFEIRTNSGSSSFIFIGGTTGTASANVSTSVWGLLTCIHTGLGGNGSCVLNGVTALPTASAAWSATTGSTLWLGTRGDLFTHLDAGLGQVKFWNQVLTLAELQYQEDQLAAKFSITISH